MAGAGMYCICHYNGVVGRDNGDGEFKYTGGEAKLRYITKDVTYSQFVQMMKDLCANNKHETFILIKHLAFGSACKIEDYQDYQAMFVFYQCYPQQPLRISITKHTIIPNPASLSSTETQLACFPRLVDNVTSHRHSRKTIKLDFNAIDDAQDVPTATIDSLPVQNTFTIKSFSTLKKNSVHTFESSEFNSGGYKWKLCLYPNGGGDEVQAEKDNMLRLMGYGDEVQDAKDHISLYLVMVDTDSLPPGWEVDVIFRFYLFDHIREKHVPIKGSVDGRFNRFYASKTKYGFSHVIPLTTLNDPCNGYLVNDTCIFGADVFVSKSSASSECLNAVKDKNLVKITFNVEGYSGISEKYLASEKVDAGFQTWQLRLYPCFMAGYTSIYLYISNNNEKGYTMSTIRLRNQRSGKHVEFEDARWFTWEGQYCGRDDFIKNDVLENEDNGFLVNDTLIIEAEIITSKVFITVAEILAL